jgi:hypothetical protein
MDVNAQMYLRMRWLHLAGRPIGNALRAWRARPSELDDVRR